MKERGYADISHLTSTDAALLCIHLDNLDAALSPVAAQAPAIGGKRARLRHSKDCDDDFCAPDCDDPNAPPQAPADEVEAVAAAMYAVDRPEGVPWASGPFAPYYFGRLARAAIAAMRAFHANKAADAEAPLTPGDKVRIEAEVSCPPDEYGGVEVNVYDVDRNLGATVSVPVGKVKR